MAPPLDIFTLHHFTSPQCAGHYVLIRVERPDYSNASQVEENRAYELAEQRCTRVFQIYENHVLQPLCLHIHCNTTVGFFEGVPPGELLYEKHGHYYLTIWIANTKYGSPLIVLGATSTESEFWNELQSDCLPENYELQKPAQQIQVYFLTEDDASHSAPPTPTA